MTDSDALRPYIIAGMLLSQGETETARHILTMHAIDRDARLTIPELFAKWDAEKTPLDRARA